jgi:hypothetical protein
LEPCFFQIKSRLIARLFECSPPKSFQVLKKAMEKRAEALREVERWESWIKAYGELAEPADSLDIPMARTVTPPVGPTDDLDIASALRQQEIPGESTKGRGHGYVTGMPPN